MMNNEPPCSHPTPIIVGDDGYQCYTYYCEDCGVTGLPDGPGIDGGEAIDWPDFDEAEARGLDGTGRFS